MPELDSQLLKTALDDFLQAPTKDHQEALMSVAGSYREAWIEAKASGGPVAVPSKKTAPPKPATTTYEREIMVRKDVGGVPVRLALQERTSKKVGPPWWVLSWRTNLESSGKNRRFYFSDGQYWQVPANDALELMQDIEARGALEDEYFDVRQKGDCVTIVSTDLDDDERDKRLAGMTADDEDWGEDPFFVIAADPNENWRKVMLVNRDIGMATFRSITTDPTYRPKKELRPGEGWWLDNSMMDANVQQTRQFRKYLQAFIDSR